MNNPYATSIVEVEQLRTRVGYVAIINYIFFLIIIKYIFILFQLGYN